MSHLRDLSIRWKLSGGFGVVLVLSAVLGVVLLTQLNSVHQGGMSIGRNSLPSVRAIDQISEDVSTYNSMIDVYPEFTGKTQAQIRTGWAGSARQVNALLDTFGKTMVDGTADAQSLAGVRRQWQAFSAKAPGVVAATQQGNAAVQALLQRIYPNHTALQATIARWIKVNMAQASEQLDANRSAFDTARTIGIILLIVIVIVIVLIDVAVAFLVSRSIKGTVDTILERLSSIRDNCIHFVSESLDAFRHGDLTHRHAGVTP